MIYGEVGVFWLCFSQIIYHTIFKCTSFSPTGIQDKWRTLLRKGRCHRVERVWTRTSKHSETHRGPLAPRFLRKGLFNLAVSPASVQSLHSSSSVSPTCLFVSHTPSLDSLQNISSFPQLLPFHPRLGCHVRTWTVISNRCLPACTRFPVLLPERSLKTQTLNHVGSLLKSFQ